MADVRIPSELPLIWGWPLGFRTCGLARPDLVPEEEKNPSQHDRLIHVYHFTKDPLQNQIQNFGDPFFLAICEGETLAEVKGRIQRKLQVPDEEFSKWKFAFISMNRPDYLQDSDVVSARFQRRDVYGAWEQYLGLEHTDTAPKRAYTANQICCHNPILLGTRARPEISGAQGETIILGL
uniref:ubiquitinyl hydrolase 1 n=1 Tax=Aegilops tauschii TaxID=37682 RepID=M8CIJ2_AEGTA